MMQEYYRLANLYTQVVNVLLEDLFNLKDYSCVRDFATRSFLIDPHNSHAHFWLVLALVKTKNNKLAWDALENAKTLLSREEYDEMVLHLGKLVPGFNKEDYNGR